MAVRNPWGLKKPVIQNAEGLPFRSQILYCCSLSNNSVYQKPSVADSQDTYEIPNVNLLYMDFDIIMESITY